MSPTQVSLYVILLLFAAISLRRIFLRRAISHYSASEVAAKLKAKEHVLLLDVRTKNERSMRHIEGSLHIPLHELRRRLPEMEKHREKEIICYCQSGNRSLSAANTLRHRGFNVANLSGGISSWLLDR